MYFNFVFGHYEKFIVLRVYMPVFTKLFEANMPGSFVRRLPYDNYVTIPMPQQMRPHTLRQCMTTSHKQYPPYNDQRRGRDLQDAAGCSGFNSSQQNQHRR